MLPLRKLHLYIINQINIHDLKLTINNNSNLGFQIQNHKNPKRLRIIWYYYQNRAISMLVHMKYQFYNQYAENLEYYQKNFCLGDKYNLYIRKNHSHSVLCRYTNDLEYIYNTYGNQNIKHCWVSTHDRKIAKSYEFIDNAWQIYNIEIKLDNYNIIICYTQGSIENIVINHMDCYRKRAYVALD